MSNNSVTSGRLAELEAVIETGMPTLLRVGLALDEIRRERLYRAQGHKTFEEYVQRRWAFGRAQAYRMIDAATVAQNLSPMGDVPLTERQARELARLEPEQQREVAAAIDFTTATAKDIHVAVEEIRTATAESAPEPDSKSDFITLSQWNEMGAAERRAVFTVRCPRCGHFNRQDGENIGWARNSWNPVTGCCHNCGYCYARDIAERWYEQGFEPSISPARLAIPYHEPVPKEVATDVSYRNVFTCSMADLFGNWVPCEWIEAVLKVVADNPQWSFLFLTKFPQRMAEFEYPSNAWLGTSVDSQARVKNAERAMRKVKATVRWVSVEPMLERIHMDFSIFNWVVMGGASRSTQTPEWRPPWRWTCEMTAEALKAGCAVYHKSNLFPERMRDYPGVIAPEPVLPPEFGLGNGAVQLKVKP